MNVQTGCEMYGVDKRREGICPGWKHDGRENVLGGKMTRGNMACVEKRLEGICPRCKKGREGICSGGNLSVILYFHMLINHFKPLVRMR